MDSVAAGRIGTAIDDAGCGEACRRFVDSNDREPAWSRVECA